VYTLLASGAYGTAVFLDFYSAFDVVDYSILIRTLLARSYPRVILSLVRSLMFEDIYLRVLVNGEVSP